MAFRLIDTERVINQVRARECLWNPFNVYYKNKMDKHKAWTEVCQAVVPKFSSCSRDDKWRIMKAVQSRWKTARDAYMKCRLADAKKPTYRARTNKYMYYDMLTFLESTKDSEDLVKHRVVIDVQEVKNSFVSENSVNQSREVSDDDSDEVSDEVMDFEIDIKDDFKDKVGDIAIEEVSADSVNAETINVVIEQGASSQNNDPLATGDVASPKKVPGQTRPTKKKSNMSEFETRLLATLRMKNKTNSSALQEDDQSFFDSLAPLIKNFNKYQKLKFRSKILELVMEIEDTHSVSIKQEPENCDIEEKGDLK